MSATPLSSASTEAVHQAGINLIGVVQLGVIGRLVERLDRVERSLEDGARRSAGSR